LPQANKQRTQTPVNPIQLPVKLTPACTDQSVLNTTGGTISKLSMLPTWQDAQLQGAKAVDGFDYCLKRHATPFQNCKPSFQH
jgi:hypothetical protein